MKISGLSCITKKIFLVFLGHPIANASLTRLSNHIKSINNSDLLEFLSFERPIKDYYLKYFDWKRRKIYMKTLFKMTSGKKTGHTLYFSVISCWQRKTCLIFIRINIFLLRHARLFGYRCLLQASVIYAASPYCGWCIMMDHGFTNTAHQQQSGKNTQYLRQHYVRFSLRWFLPLWCDCLQQNGAVPGVIQWEI